jgi:hypothetical protein
MSRTIEQYRQVTDVFSQLFLVDPIRDEWYKDIQFDSDQVLSEKWNLSANELYALQSYYKLYDHTDNIATHISIEWKNEIFHINLNQVWNNNSGNMEINGCKPFIYNEFRNLFKERIQAELLAYILSSNIPKSVSIHYVDILMDKINMDLNNTSNGPKTFESMLLQENTKLYNYVISLRSKPDSMVNLMRTLIRGMEEWCDKRLNGLLVTTISEDEYINILKDVISYFKSYMVEFTRSEFKYLLDGLWDQGGNPNMIKLEDGMVNSTVTLLPKDSISLYDASHQTHHIMFMDNQQIPRSYNPSTNDTINLYTHGLYWYLIEEEGHICCDNCRMIWHGTEEDVVDDPFVCQTCGLDWYAYNQKQITLRLEAYVNKDLSLLQDNMTIRYQSKYKDIKTLEDVEILYDDGYRVTRLPLVLTDDDIVTYMIGEHTCHKHCIDSFSPGECEYKNKRQVIVSVKNAKSKQILPKNYVGNGLPNE